MNFPTPKKGAARCPRFDSCNAPVCPLDAWERAGHLRGEPVCLWLREAVKPGGMARIADAAGQDIADTVGEALPAIMDSNSDIRHKLKAASRTGSKLASGARLHALSANNTPRPAPKISGRADSPPTAQPCPRPSAIGDDHGRG